MSGLKYWIWLAELPGLRSQTRLALLEHFGDPENIYCADAGEILLVENMTREQAAVTIVNYLTYKGYDLPASPADPGYKDGYKISAWAKNAVAICTELGLFTGSDGKFAPNKKLTRAECAVVVLKLDDLIASMAEIVPDPPATETAAPEQQAPAASSEAAPEVPVTPAPTQSPDPSPAVSAEPTPAVSADPQAVTERTGIAWNTPKTARLSLSSHAFLSSAAIGQIR